MGWLRNLMDSRDPRVGSFDQLAQSCLAHGEWPAGVRPQTRSLAALFSKFDRDIELEWLEDRAQAQVALARVLRCPLSLLQSEVRKRVRSVDSSSPTFRLLEAPFARFLNLTEVGLPPGVPGQLSRPAQWQTLWWSSSHGNGREFVRHWLRARGLARTCHAGSLSEFESLLEGEQPLWVELDFVLDGGTQLPTRPRLCVVANAPAPPGFQSLPQVPVTSYLSGLLAWLTDWFGGASQFDAARAAEWIGAAVEGKVADCFDAVVGLAAVFDEFGWEALQGRRLEDIAQQWLERRFGEVEADRVVRSTWPKSRLFELLVQLAQAHLRQPGGDWFAPRPLGDWSALVPSEVRRTLDARSAQQTLARGRRTLDEVEDALRPTTATEDEALRALLALRCLDPDAAQRFRLRPRWIANLALERAVTTVTESDVSAWGASLLQPERAARVRDFLLSRLRQGEVTVVDRLLERNDDVDPAAVLGCETLALLVGRVLLEGGEFEAAQLKGLFALQLSYLVTSARAIPAPRLLCLPVDTEVYTDWQLAWWAIAERVAPDPYPCPPELDPWGNGPLPDAATLDRIVRRLATAEDTDAGRTFCAQVYGLLGRLYQHELEGEMPHPALLPTRIQTDSPWPPWKALMDLPRGLVAVATVLRRDEWPALAACAWAAWMGSDFDSAALNAFQAPEHQLLLWPHVPARVLLALLRSGVLSESILWSALNADQLGAVLNAATPAPRIATGLFGALPEELLPLALDWARAEDADLPWKVLWERFDARLLELTLDRFTEQPAATFPVLRHLPAKLRPRVVRELTARTRSHDAQVQAWLRECLHVFAVERQLGWFEAYEALLELAPLNGAPAPPEARG